ncbi:hypothetical protein [Crocosphaera sp. Alani8]|uniref:hypothetical protein n=1 Tax=Crocosphaera sp. Alani8 TaxID=3038952 RepID=UPI00313AEDE4
MISELKRAKKVANIHGLNIQEIEYLLEAIETVFQCHISEKYKAIFYLATTGLYLAEDMANIYDHSPKNINGDFNKNLGQYLKVYLELEDSDRVGITSLRRIMFKQGYFQDDIAKMSRESYPNNFGDRTH